MTSRSTDALDSAAAERPDNTAVTSFRHDTGQERTLTYAELAAIVDRVAIGLHRLGVRAGDVVAVQLPNWWHFTATYLACARVGAVINPLMPIFRERELGFMLNHGEAKIAIVPSVFRGHDFPTMYETLKEQVPSLEHVVAVGGAGPTSFEALLSDPPWEIEPDADSILTATRLGPDDITQLIYTSGTTGEPKGVMHSSNTLFANVIPFADRLRLGADDVVLMPSPMAHSTGFIYGLMMPVQLGCPAVLLDIWDPSTAVDLINRHRATFTMASTPFLTDLTQTVANGVPVPSLQVFLCAGAPIPNPLVEQAQQALGAIIVSAWGMSENGAVTTTLLDDDPSRAVNTDGYPLPGVDIKVVDTPGHDLPPGEPGRLLVRACSNFGGYLKRPHLNATDDAGWFDTGDLAQLDEHGYIRITG